MDPDYPNGRVRMRPAFPSAWPKASVRTPDFTFDYRQEGDADHFRLTLQREAEVDFRLPIRAEQVWRVTLNGQADKWHTVEGFGCTSGDRFHREAGHRGCVDRTRLAAYRTAGPVAVAG